MLGAPIEGRRARLWVLYAGGLVKITLDPDESISVFETEATDEGWRRVFLSWYHAGDRIERILHTVERDCDGIFEYHSESVAALDRLAVIPSYPDPGVKMPDWQIIDDRQRDHSAEKAGY